MTVRKLMTRRFVSVRPDQTIEEANELMRRGGFRHLPVLDQDRLVGILSDHDVELASRFTTKEEQRVREFHSGVLVREAMSTCPVTLSPVDKVADALRLAIDRKIGAYPVVEGDKVVGILTTTDLLRWCLAALEEGVPEEAFDEP